MTRFITALICLVLTAAACGVDRTSDDVLGADADPATGTEAAPGDADDDAAAEAATPTTLAPQPMVSAPAGDIAISADFGDGTVEITHGELADVVVPTTENDEFVTLAFGGVSPPGFQVGVLTEQLVSRALLLEIEQAGAEVTETDLADSRQLLLGQIASLFPASADPTADAERLYDEVPYLQFLATYQAGQEVLTAAVVEGADPTEGNPCVRHILVDTEPEAAAIVDRLADGEDFAELAIELSTGPSGPGGGELGCAPSSNYVGPFAEAVDAAEIGEFVGPVETEFGFHVLVVDRYEVDGRTLAAERLRERLGEAQVDVDERLGSWDDAQLTIVPSETG